MRPTLWLTLFAAAALTGCGPKNQTAGDAPSGSASSSEAVKQAPKGEGDLQGDLEVVAFKGGFGIDFYEQCAKEFQAKNPGLKIKLEGNPRTWEQLRPRFVGGNPPDLTFPGWGMDHWGLVEEGQLLALDDALKSPSADGKTPWGETFEPTLLKLGQRDGHQYMLPYYVMLYGWWHDPKVFAANGWKVPTTWDELLVLCEQIKSKGIAPITYQGQYPYYMVEGMLLPWCISSGGIEAANAAQNLEPGAWKSPAMLKAAQMIDELNTKGYFQKGATAMSHTEAQTEFLNGKAAMVPCGSWLYSEMKNVMPPGAQMEFMLPPVLTDGKGDKTAVLIGIEPWMVPAAGKNPNAAVALFKSMTSLENAKKFVEQKGTLMSIKGSDEANLPDVLKVPAKVFRNAQSVFSNQYRQWYPEFEKELENALTSMLNKELTPEAFCDRVEAAAEKTRQDPAIKKYKV